MRKELLDKNGHLRLLVKHMTLYKGYRKVMFFTQKMDPEIHKAKVYVENQKENLDADFDEFRVGSNLYEIKEQMKDILNYSKNVQKMLDNKTNYFMKIDNSYWFKMELKLSELNEFQELLRKIDFFFHGRGISKDDYIKATMQAHKDVMDYSDEVEQDHHAVVFCPCGQS